MSTLQPYPRPDWRKKGNRERKIEDIPSFGRPAGEPRIHGVGFAIKNNLVRQLTELPQGISERLMTSPTKAGQQPDGHCRECICSHSGLTR